MTTTWQIYGHEEVTRMMVSLSLAAFCACLPTMLTKIHFTNNLLTIKQNNYEKNRY